MHILLEYSIRTGGDSLDLMEAVLRIKRGDETVYAEIIDEFSHYLATVIHNVYSLNVQDTEDVIAETILSLWKNAKRLREDLNFTVTEL